MTLTDADRELAQQNLAQEKGIHPMFHVAAPGHPQDRSTLSWRVGG